MYALIINDAVHELFAEDPKLNVGLKVVDASAFFGVAVGWLLDEDGETLSAPPPPPPPTKAELLAHAAARRWEAETGGITVNGARIDTSRESQTMIDKAFALSKEDPAEIVAYKAASGFVEIDAATIKAIALAVGRHVRACFAAEKLMADAIEAGTVTDYAKIDSAWTV